MVDVQAFIEEYYPDYSRSDEIAREGDLHKLIFSPGEIEADDCAYDLFLEDFLPSHFHHKWEFYLTYEPMIALLKTEYYEIRTKILESAILNYINETNTSS